MPESRSISFAVEEEDPWSTARFDPVVDMSQPLTRSQVMDEDMVTEGITAANALGNLKTSFRRPFSKRYLINVINSRSRFT